MFVCVFVRGVCGVCLGPALFHAAPYYTRGTEHVIHHYVVAQPFWVRHGVRGAAWAAMEKEGVRVNDFDAVFVRGQRWGKEVKGA